MSIRNSEINFFYKELKEVLKKFIKWRKLKLNTAVDRLLDYINLCNIFYGNLVSMDSTGKVKIEKLDEENIN